ncbi:MAG: head-tail connector protein [Alphaproteobacteria bacterium]|nr:head-tail connector protein [Alphaproteobacteria bacterium]
MSLQLVTPASASPVSLAEAKAHLKLDTDDDDARLTAMIAAAATRAEWHTGRAFLTQGWILWLDQWPHDGIAEIPLPPLQAVSEVAFHDPQDERSVADPSAYRVESAAEPGRLVFADSPPRLRRTAAIEIAFTAGYGDAAAVPQAVKEAILEIVADLYAHRGDEYGPVGLAGQALLAPYRMLKV